MSQNERAGAEAEAFDRLFQQVYLTYHRRDAKRGALEGASRAVLTHLSMAGPLTVGELTHHLDRAQSVVSDIVTGLERKGLLERRSDPEDRRRTFVWLTEAGREVLSNDASVLGLPLLTSALQRMPAQSVSDLLAAMRGLVEASYPSDHTTHEPKENDHDHRAHV